MKKIPNHNFNSIKVRLKLQLIKSERRTQIFQFHKGTIKTNNDKTWCKDAHPFQFHKGTIKTCLTPYKRVLLVFQFHKGTIKTGSSGGYAKIGSSFQFHKGTIKTLNKEVGGVPNSISIP